MSEFFYDPADSPAAARPASPDQQNELAQYARAIERDGFEADLITGSEYRASYPAGLTKVTISTSHRTVDLCVVERLLPADDDRTCLPGGGYLFKHSNYDFIRRARSGDYAFDSHNAYEEYFIHRGGRETLAFSERRYRDRSLGWSLRAHREARKRERQAEAMWNIGVLTAGRCAELIELAKAFDPATARNDRG